MERFRNSFQARPIEAGRGESFEEKWQERATLGFPGGSVEVYDLHPDNEKTAVPVVFIPGWGGTPEMYKKNLEVLVGLNRRTISANAPHGIESELHPSESEHMPDAELRKVAAFMQMLDDKKIEKTNAIGHSEGCIDVVIAATLYPERFKNIVLVNPGGMIGEDNLWRLSTCFTKDIVKTYVDAVKNKTLRGPLMRASKEVTASVVTSPVKAFREILSISNTQIHEMLKELKKQGIGISIIHGVDDEVFPMDRVQDITTSEMVDGFYSVKGRHGQFQLEADLYTKLAESALSALEQKSQNTQ